MNKQDLHDTKILQKGISLGQEQGKLQAQKDILEILDKLIKSYQNANCSTIQLNQARTEIQALKQSQQTKNLNNVNRSGDTLSTIEHNPSVLDTNPADNIQNKKEGAK